jgi:hypothetical protein
MSWARRSGALIDHLAGNELAYDVAQAPNSRRVSGTTGAARRALSAPARQGRHLAASTPGLDETP